MKRAEKKEIRKELKREKWDGKLPQQMFGGNAVPFISVPQGSR